MKNVLEFSEGKLIEIDDLNYTFELIGHKNNQVEFKTVVVIYVLLNKKLLREKAIELFVKLDCNLSESLNIQEI